MDCLDIGALRAVFELLQQHYPERQAPGPSMPVLRTSVFLRVHGRLGGCLHRLAIMYMLDAPTIFWALWRAVSPFIDPETKQKVRFVSAKDAAQAFEALPGEVRVCIVSCRDPKELATVDISSWMCSSCRRSWAVLRLGSQWRRPLSNSRTDSGATCLWDGRLQMPDCVLPGDCMHSCCSAKQDFSATSNPASTGLRACMWLLSHWHGAAVLLRLHGIAASGLLFFPGFGGLLTAHCGPCCLQTVCRRMLM